MQDDKRLLRLELWCATLTGIMGGHYWGIFVIGMAILSWPLDLARGILYVRLMGFGLLIMLPTHMTVEYVKTHRRGLGFTWTYPPTSMTLLRMEMIRLAAVIFAEIIGLIAVSLYVPDFWLAVLGGIVVGIGNGANAYFIRSHDPKRRSAV